jgi:hypothetical protein
MVTSTATATSERGGAHQHPMMRATNREAVTEPPPSSRGRGSAFRRPERTQISPTTGSTLGAAEGESESTSELERGGTTGMRSVPEEFGGYFEGQFTDDEALAIPRETVISDIEDLLDLFTPTGHESFRLSPRQAQLNRECNSMSDWLKHRKIFLREASFGYLFIDTETQREEGTGRYQQIVFLTVMTAFGTCLHFDLRKWKKLAAGGQQVHNALPQELLQHFRPESETIFVGVDVQNDFNSLFPFRLLATRFLDTQVIFDGLIQRGE